MRSEFQNRSVLDPETDTPWDHNHQGEWVTMILVAERDKNDSDAVRQTLIWRCPTCQIELTVSTLKVR